MLRRAETLYETGQIRDALEVAQAAAEREPKSADAWSLLGRIARHAGLVQASDQAFQRAAELSRRHPAPVRLTPADFAAVVERASAQLSPDARRRLEARRLRLAELPTESEIRAGIKPDALVGRSNGDAPVLTLYQANLENRARSEAALRGLIEKTLAKA
ncbi:MAG TPA: tetratricopeptide repeat protein [Candidatus Dormibacteraeota bacterium]